MCVKSLDIEAALTALEASVAHHMCHHLLSDAMTRSDVSVTSRCMRQSRYVVDSPMRQYEEETSLMMPDEPEPQGSGSTGRSDREQTAGCLNAAKGSEGGGCHTLRCRKSFYLQTGGGGVTLGGGQGRKYRGGFGCTENVHDRCVIARHLCFGLRQAPWKSTE
jgi:hypothetical protein